MKIRRYIYSSSARL